MKQLSKKSQKIVKGMPSAVVLSIVIHVGLFLLAGMLVVFTVVKKEEKRFVPPKAVERPKMKLRKPKVKVKKSTKPRASTRIVTKVNRASMPDIQLPEMSGMTAGLTGGIEGFDLMPDLGEITVFGGGQTIGNDFVGTFYDFKRDRSGRPIIMDPDKLIYELKEFVRGGWKISDFARYYRSPKKLYTTTFMVPPTRSAVAPAAFDETGTLGYCWAAHYKGQLVYKDGITFRFWGHGDAFMLVRVDGTVVLNCSWPTIDFIFTPHWQSSSADSRKYYLGNNLSVVGDWITLAPGVPFDMEVIFGDLGGGEFCSMLVVEVKGVEYGKNRQNGPCLPIFKTAEPSLDLIEAIYGDLIPGEASVTNGPTFCDYDSRSRATTNNVEEIDLPASSLASCSDCTEIRTWTRVDGDTLEAGFVAVIGDKVVLKDLHGKQRKLPLIQLAEEDREFIELAQPPEFNIDFSKQSSQLTIETSPFNDRPPPKILNYVFGAKLTQTSAGQYNHELHVEFFAVGEEIDGDNYILFDRQESNFMPTKENRRSHVFRGRTVPVVEHTLYGDKGERRGQKYGGYLIVVTDERGKIIQHAESNKRLFDSLGKLRGFPIGRHFDKTCTRVDPPRPKPVFY